MEAEQPKRSYLPHRQLQQNADIKAYQATDSKGERGDAPALSRENPHDNRVFTALFAALILIVSGAFIFPGSYDNDVWFFLATGEEIVHNGIPYENPFSVHEGMGIVVQQWLLCVIVYLIYGAFGFVGVGVYVLALAVALVASLYALGRSLRGTKGGSEIIMAIIAAAVYAMYPFMTVRPHLYSMMAFVWTVFFLERYRASSDARWLIPLPFLVIVHVNLQAAMAPYDLAIICCYLVPDVLPALHRRGIACKVALFSSDYPRVPLLVTLCLCAAALLVNPYGVDGALYLLHSFGAASYGDYISEMLPLVPFRTPVFAVSILIALVAIVGIGRQGSSRIDLPLVLLIIVDFLLAFTYLRNLWLIVLFGAIYLFRATRDLSIRFPAHLSLLNARLISGSILIIGGVGFAISVCNAVPELETEPENDDYTPIATCDYLDGCGIPKSEIDVFTFFNGGGYLEYRGYRVNVDPRPELWGTSITGHDKDYYREYIDMALGDMYFDDYLDLYDFDVCIIPDEEPAGSFFVDNPDYIELPGGDDYAAYGKAGIFASEGRHPLSES